MFLHAFHVAQKESEEVVTDLPVNFQGDYKADDLPLHSNRPCKANFMYQIALGILEAKCLSFC